MQLFKYNINTTEKKLFLGLIFAVISMFFVYGYFVNATIINIVERKSAETRTGELITVISDLEMEHGSLRKRITLNYARSIGFIEPKHQTFASHKQLVKNVQRY